MKPPKTPTPRKQRSLRADSEEPNLGWRMTKHGVEIAYFRMRIEGKDTWERLGEIAPKSARSIIRERRRTLGEAELLRRLGAVDDVRDVSKVSELLAAYRAYFAGTDNDSATATKNENSFLLILKRGASAGEEASISKFSVDTMLAYESESIKQVRAAAAGDPKAWPKERIEAKLASTRRTIAATARQARSLFADEAKRSEHYRKLTLPDLDDVMALEVGDRSLPGYRRPAASVVDAVVAGIEGLRTTNPGMWLAAMIEIVTGARRGTLVHARWDWFVDRGAIEFESGRRVVTFEIRVAKGGESDVPMYLEDFELLKSARVGKGDFIVPGKDEAERLEVLLALVPFLRGLGLDRRQPNHELRKLFADSKRKAHGAEETTGALGHSDPKLLKYYTESGPRRAVSLLDVLDPHRALKEKLDLDKLMRAQLAQAAAKPQAS